MVNRLRIRWNLALLLVSLAFTIPVMADELVIPGSGNPEVVLKALAEVFNKQQTQHHVSVPPSTGAAGALREVEAGSTVLGRIGRPLKPDESARGLSYVALGRDPVVFVAGANVTVKGLTRAQAVDVYTGKISNWRDTRPQHHP
jgi:phosphate transport system substrate-binding protein